MIYESNTRHYHLPALLVLITMMSSGCAMITPRGSDEIDSGPTYTVEILPAFGPKKMFRGSLEPGMTVDLALVESGAKKKFSNMAIDVYRMESGRPLKMPVSYAPRQKHVSYEQDYAVHDGDRIVVRSKSMFPLTEITSSLNPLK